MGHLIALSLMPKLNLNHTIAEHSGALYALAHGPQGQVISGGADRVVVGWNEQGEQSKLLVQVGKGIYSLHYAEKSETLLVGNAEGGIHVVDLNQGKEARLMDVHKKGVFAFAEGENDLVYSAGGQGILAVWQLPEFELIRAVPVGEMKLRGLATSNDGHLALAGTDGVVRVLEPELLNEVYAYTHPDAVFSVAWHPSKGLLVTGCKDAHLRVIDLSVEDPLVEIPAHNFGIYDIKFSPDGKYFATASFDKTIKLWDAQTMEVVDRREFPAGHISSVNQLVWTVDGRLWSASDDRTIKIWAIE